VRDRGSRSSGFQNDLRRSPERRRSTKALA
jgi:hypothetical protein